MKAKIDALLLTHNETDILNKCLDSIKDLVKNIIVVDDFSDTKTIDILKKYNCSTYQRKLDNFASQRNYGLSKIKSNWVLWIDADEVLPKNLILEIKSILKNPEYNGYLFYRNDYFFGKNISINQKFKDKNKLLLRLFKKEGSRFQGKVHESIIIKGNISPKPFKIQIEHYSYKSINNWIEKMKIYTSLEAEKIYDQFGKKNLLWIIFNCFLESSRYFFGYLFFYGGIKNGFVGIIWATISAFYKLIKYFKYYELLLLKFSK